MKKAVVKIKSYDKKGGSLKQTGTGSCFYISESGKLYVLTANHVAVQNGFPLKHFTVTFLGSDVDYDATIYRSYQNIDVAVLALNNYPSGVRILELGTSKDVSGFEKVYGWGYPGGGISKSFEGSVSASSEDKIYLNSISFDKGNSGGPLLSKKTNKIIGIILQKAENNTEQYARAIDFTVIYLRSDHILKKAFSNTYGTSVVEDKGQSLVNALSNSGESTNTNLVNYGVISFEGNGVWSEYINGVFLKSYNETGRDQVFIYLTNSQSNDETYAIPHHGGLIQFKNYSTNYQWAPLLNTNLAYNHDNTHFLVTSDGNTWYNYEFGNLVRTYYFVSRDATWIYVRSPDGTEEIALPIYGGAAQMKNASTNFVFTPFAIFNNTRVTYSYQY